MSVESKDVIIGLNAVEQILDLIYRLVAGQLDNLSPEDRKRVTEYTQGLKKRAQAVLDELEK